MPVSSIPAYAGMTGVSACLLVLFWTVMLKKRVPLSLVLTIPMLVACYKVKSDSEKDASTENVKRDTQKSTEDTIPRTVSSQTDTHSDSTDDKNENSDTHPPEPDSSTDDCDQGSPPNDAIILVDFENGITRATCQGLPDTRCVGIYTIHDGTGVLDPDPENGIDAPATLMDRCGSSLYAMCLFSDTGFEHWGSGFRLDLNASMEVYGERAPYDLTPFEGIGFWAVHSDGAAGLRVGFPDNNTDTASDNCFDALYNLASWEEVIEPIRDNSQDCENHWSATILLQKTWTYHEILFDNLAISSIRSQRGADGFLQDQVYAIEFRRDPSDKPFYFCVDDIALLPKN